MAITRDPPPYGDTVVAEGLVLQSIGNCLTKTFDSAELAAAFENIVARAESAYQSRVDPDSRVQEEVERLLAHLSQCIGL